MIRTRHKVRMRANEKGLRKDENPMKRLTREVRMRTNEKDDNYVKKEAMQ
jgi:hypothetical protein